MPEVEREEKMENIIKELTLLLIYFTSWEEKIITADEPVLRSWKTFRFEILDKLIEEGLITGSKKSKSVYLTEDGVKLAEALKKKYLSAK